MEPKKSRVVVTALGVCSPLGFSMTSFTEQYLNKASEGSTKINDLDLEMELSKFKTINQRRMDRITKISMLAAASCLRDAGLEMNASNINDVGGIFGTEYGPIASARNFIHSGFELGLSSASPLLFPYTVGNAAPGTITILMGARGFNTTLSGHNPVAYTYDVIKSGKAKAILAGGFEELAPEIESAYQNRTITDKNQRQQPAPIALPSEGSAMLFVEEASFASSRNAKVLFEICGYGVCSNLQQEERSIDNFGYIPGKVIEKTMRLAFSRSGIEPDQISLIISLSRTDSKQTTTEAEAIGSIWGDSTPAMHFVKQLLGETFGASGCFAAIAAYISGKIHPKEEGQTVYIAVNSYHIGGNCFTVIIAL